MSRLLHSTASDMSKVISYLRSVGCVDDNNEKIIAFGIKRLVNTFLDLLFCIIISGIMGNIPVGILFEICGFLLRIYAGGYHAPTPGICLVLTYTSILSGLFGVFFLSGSILFWYIVAILSFTLIIAVSPIESPNKPLYPEERLYYRKKSIGIAVAEFLFLSAFVYTDAYLYVKAIAVSVFFVALGQAAELLLRKKSSGKPGCS